MSEIQWADARACVERMAVAAGSIPNGAGRPPEATRIAAHTVRVGHTRLHYLAAGTGPPLVLVHGLSASSRWWMRNIAALAVNRRVYALDLVGFGRSRPKYRFSLERAVDNILGWMDATGLVQADFCGHSMGGQLCIHLAATSPKRVDRLVLVNASGLSLDASLPRLAWRCLRSSGQSRFHFAPTVLHTTLQAGPLVMLGAVRSLLHDDVTETLGRIGVPTLIICGERDAIVPLVLGHALHRAIPHARLAVVPQAGHNVMYDRAAHFNRLVLDFLDSTPGGTDRRATTPEPT